MARGIVLVLPGMFPATIIVAQNSPSALAKLRIRPAVNPLFASGRVTRKRVWISDFPRVNAAFSYSISTDSIAAFADFIIIGIATTVAATTAACHVNIMLQPVKLYI